MLTREIFSTLDEKFRIARPCNVLYLLHKQEILHSFNNYHNKFYHGLKFSCRGGILNIEFTLALRRSMTSSIMNLIRTGKSLRLKSCWIRSKY